MPRRPSRRASAPWTLAAHRYALDSPPPSRAPPASSQAGGQGDQDEFIHAGCLCTPDVLLDRLPSLSAQRTNPGLDTRCNRRGLIAGLGGRAGLTKTTTPVSRFPFSHASPSSLALVSSHVVFRLGFARLSASSGATQPDKGTAASIKQPGDRLASERGFASRDLCVCCISLIFMHPVFLLLSFRVPVPYPHHLARSLTDCFLSFTTNIIQFFTTLRPVLLSTTARAAQ